MCQLETVLVTGSLGEYLPSLRVSQDKEQRNGFCLDRIVVHFDV